MTVSMIRSEVSPIKDSPAVQRYDVFQQSDLAETSLQALRQPYKSIGLGLQAQSCSKSWSCKHNQTQRPKEKKVTRSQQTLKTEIRTPWGKKYKKDDSEMLPDLCWGVYQGMVWAVYHTLLSFVIINATSSRIIIVAPSCVLSFTSSSASSPHPSLIPNLI